jgi:hypothetical protein
MEAVVWPEYCFHVPVISGVFPQDLVTGIFDLGTSLINKYIAQIKNFKQYLQTYQHVSVNKRRN